MKLSKSEDWTVWVKISGGMVKRLFSMAANLDDCQEISGDTIDTLIAGRKAWMFWGRYPKDVSVEQNLMLTQQEELDEIWI